MRAKRICLVLFALLVAVMVPSVAAAAGKVKTRIVFTNAIDDANYYAWWSLDDTSVPTPVARGRLMYYKPSVRKWVGYGKRPVTLWRTDIFGDAVAAGRTTTNGYGYFSFRLKAPTDYLARYNGSATSYATSRACSRVDGVASEVVSRATTSSIDASRTLITITNSYRYNRFIPASPGMKTTVFTMRYDNEGGPDFRVLWDGWVGDTQTSLTGEATATIDVVVPPQLLADPYTYVGMYNRVDYWTPEYYAYISENDNEGPWLGTPISPPALEEEFGLTSLLCGRIDGFRALVSGNGSIPQRMSP